MTDLANQAIRDSFLTRLEKCEAAKNILDSYDADFVKSMREGFESREQSEDLGTRPWTPTTRQWNYLLHVADEL